MIELVEVSNLDHQTHPVKSPLIQKIEKYNNQKELKSFNQLVKTIDKKWDVVTCFIKGAGQFLIEMQINKFIVEATL